MTATGFSYARAMPHDQALHQVFHELARRGYRPRELEPNGDRPDLQFVDADRNPAYADIKVPQPDSNHVSIKRTALETYARIVLIERREVYIVAVHPNGRWKVDNVDSARARILKGPRRANGNGSRTDWILIACGGTDFDEYFPSVG